jgi:glycosyltransferase involved in cell wall biosynthesis
MTRRIETGRDTVTAVDRITVCVCTFHRPLLLARLLGCLERQTSSGQFDCSVVIVDNDRLESARGVVEPFGRTARVPVRYYVEPEQNIALARNMAARHADGDLVAFIDDDEEPIDEWLLRMHRTLHACGADGVFGPVQAAFTVAPPPWMLRAGVFDRPSYPATGSPIEWRQTGMGNVLVRREALDELDGPFRKEFGSGGEDVDFFRRSMARGRRFVWCGEAVVYETVPPERTRLSFQMRRALMRGKMSLAHPSERSRGVVKSLAATAIYTTLLPAFLLRGRHVFVKYLIKDLDHIGKLLALCGIDAVGDKYIVK